MPLNDDAPRFLIVTAAWLRCHVFGWLACVVCKLDSMQIDGVWSLCVVPLLAVPQHNDGGSMQQLLCLFSSVCLAHSARQGKGSICIMHTHDVSIGSMCGAQCPVYGVCVILSVIWSVVASRVWSSLAICITNSGAGREGDLHVYTVMARSYSHATVFAVTVETCCHAIELLTGLDYLR